MNITAKQFKQGYIYSKNGHTIWFGQGRYYFTALYENERFSTLKELKQYLKTI